jgi:hypothetical protein
LQLSGGGGYVEIRGLIAYPGHLGCLGFHYELFQLISENNSERMVIFVTLLWRELS